MNFVRPARTALWVAVWISTAAFGYLVVKRVPHPAELDYIEGVMMDHIVRLSEARPIYVEPSLDFIPLAYMPGFAFTASLLVHVFGAELWVPRLVSCGAMIVLAFLVAFIVRRETRSTSLAAAGAGLLFASFGVTGGYYDVARPDSLMLMLAISGVAILRFTSTPRGAWLSALVLTAAFFTKQHAIWFALAAVCHLYFTDRRRLTHFAGALVLGCCGGYLALSLWLGPWFSYFTWNEPSHWSSLDRGRIADYLGYRLLGRYGLLMTLIVSATVLPGRAWSGRSGLWAWIGLAGLATGLMATLDPHAYTHVLTPSVVVLCVLGPLAAYHVLTKLASLEGSATSWRAAVVWFLLFCQFAPLYYGVRGMRPRPGAEQARTAFLAYVRKLPGRVLVIYHGNYAHCAGKGTGLQMIALDDIIRSRENRLLAAEPDFVDRLFDPLREGAPNRPVLITDEYLADSGDQSNPWWRDLAGSYELHDVLAEDISTGLRPVVGSGNTPRYVYVPIERKPEFTVETSPGARKRGEELNAPEPLPQSDDLRPRPPAASRR
jgi:hypothetical protein